MEYRRLGKSGLQISVLSFGSWVTFGNQIGNKVAENMMAYAYDHGVNFFDNAEVYAFGESERVMGRILSKMNWTRSSYLVSSKAFFGDGGQKPNQTGLSRKHLFEACHAALRRLQVDYLDLFYCHRPDKNVGIEETVWAMHHLIQQGKILYWGTSEWSAQEIMEAHLFAKQNHLIGPIVEQPQYNMFYRDKVEVEFKQIYKTVGLGTTIWSPLASGILTDKYIQNIPAGTRMDMDDLEWLKKKSLTPERLEKVKGLNQVAAELNTTLPKLAIAWCVKNPDVSTAILGASKMEQLEENMEALTVAGTLTEEVMERIELILQNKPKHPAF